MRFFNTRTLIGIVVVILGISLLLERMGYIDEGLQIWSYWPVIPLALGVSWMISSFSVKHFFPWGKFITSLILMIIGILYLGATFNLGIDGEIINRFWSLVFPVLIIIVGFSLLRGKTTGDSGKVAIMGGIEVGKGPWKLKSGSYLAFMGGVELDLTTAEIPDGETVLDLTAVCGGIDVTIPSHVSVSYEGIATLGGITFLDHEDGGIIASKTTERLTETSEKSIHFQARALMGGVEIKEKLATEKESS